MTYCSLPWTPPTTYKGSRVARGLSRGLHLDSRREPCESEDGVVMLIWAHYNQLGDYAWEKNFLSVGKTV